MALILGNNKKNKLPGTNGNDVMLGFGGNDTLLGKGGNDTLHGGKGNDAIDGGKGNDRLFGDQGDDVLAGGAGADKLNGGAGNDFFLPGNDFVTDVINGGAGNDTVDYSNHSFAVQASLPDNAGAGGAVDIFIGVENVIGSAFADNMRSANGGFALGNGGDDTLYGGGSLNATDNGGIIRGDAGADTLHMEFGNTLAWLQRGQGADQLLNFVENQDKLFIKLFDWGFGATFDANEIRNFPVDPPSGTGPQFVFDPTGVNPILALDPNGDGNLIDAVIVATFVSSTFDGFIKNLDVGDFVF